MSELLKIDHLSCGYGDRPVLDGVSLEVREGEAVLLAGPNGCGKSTFQSDSSSKYKDNDLYPIYQVEWIVI